MYENEAIVLEQCHAGTGVYFAVKRGFDIIMGLLGILFLIPVTILIKIATLISGDKNSIFFTQTRIGKNGKPFKLYKFRTMIPDADKALTKILKKDKKLKEEYRIHKKLRNDPRITKIGNFLRRTSLDEVPQFLNVLKGEMSLIGNRPYLPRERKEMGAYYQDIVKTSPGITGYWQVCGRNDLSFKRRLMLEQFYSNHCSFRLDAKIFFKTFRVVLLGKGAK